MLTSRYKGLRIEPTPKAVRELLYHDADLNDVVEVLENGYDCSASRRAENIVERCLKKGNKEIRVVVAKIWVKTPEGDLEEEWKLIHFGITR